MKISVIISVIITTYLFISLSCNDKLSTHATTREVINEQGQKLEQTFSNDDHDLKIGFQDEIIYLKKDTSAVGSHYVNKEYSYTNINGTATLKRGDTILFIHSQY